MSDSLFAASGGIDPAVLEAARAELAEKLPELRELPGFPMGSDEDILRMSVPPYYTACPNPFIEEWLAESAPEGHGDRDYVDPGPFASDVSASKGHRFYKAHAYWTKVPHELIMRYILHYTRPGDVVLDGFAGSGMTGVAAQSCGSPDPSIKAAIEAELDSVEWGTRRAVLQDLSPVASFMSAGLNLQIDADSFAAASLRILDELDLELGWMYRTMHTDGSIGSIRYTVWSDVFSCPLCGDELVFYEVAFDPASGKVLDEFTCPGCGSSLGRRQLDRRMETVRDPASGGASERAKRVPVLISYRVGNKVWEKSPDEDDLRVLERVTTVAESSSVPSGSLPYGHSTHERHNLPARGLTTFDGFWHPRARASLSFLWSRASEIEDPSLRLATLYWIEQAVWGLSWMNRYKANDYSQVNRFQNGMYYISSLVSECSPRYNLEGSSPSRGKRATLIKVWGGATTGRERAMVSTGSSEYLAVPAESVDYVFVDPPFGENFLYAELNYLIEKWHGVLSARESDAVVNRSPRVSRSLDEYTSLLSGCFDEFFRVLRPGRWMTVEFSNSSNEVWLALQEAVAAAGFVVADTRILDKQSLTFIQVTAKNVVKRDLILSCYKPSSESASAFSLVAGSSEGAWEFVTEHLSHLPMTEGHRGEGGVVRERFADRLYDRMVAYHVHRSVSVPLTAGEFYAGLERQFPVRDDMYFLSEQVEAYERHRMTFKELAQLEFFITGEASAVQWLRQLLKKKPLSYAEIHPLFLAELQDGVSEWEELPELRDLLDESFLQDAGGKWFVPDPKKAADLEAQRTRALLREFAEYREGKGRLVSFRSEAVRVGFKDAWGRRNFAEIVAVGSRLRADAFVEDESLLYYYDNAKRLIAES